MKLVIFYLAAAILTFGIGTLAAAVNTFITDINKADSEPEHKSTMLRTFLFGFGGSCLTLASLALFSVIL